MIALRTLVATIAFLALGVLAPAGSGAPVRSTVTVAASVYGPVLFYAGRPLYYYAGDRKARQILCQDVSEFGGLWLVVRGSGAPVR